MRRSTLACFSGMVGLLAVASAGCEDWQHVLDGVPLPDRAPTTPEKTGTGGVSGAAGAPGTGVASKCEGTTGPKGEACKTCYDPSGMIVYQECAPVDPTGAAGSSGSSDPQMCVKFEDGGPGSCKDPSTWKDYGWDYCKAQNLALTDLALGPDCGGGFQSATYVCCGPSTGSGTGGSTGTTPPPPPPGMCIVISDGGPTSCKDAATWKRYGSDSCKGQNLVLSDYKLGESCGDGYYRDVAYVCCGTTPPPAPDPVECSESVDASGRPCKLCYDAAGKLVTTDCREATPTPPPTDGSVMTDPVACAERVDDTGAVCKVCLLADGSRVSSCPTAPPPN
jgi:hypothetical protein